MGSWEENHRGEGPFLSHYVNGTCSQHDNTDDVSLDQLAEVVSARFLRCKVSVHPFPCSTF